MNIGVYSTCPKSSDAGGRGYLESVREAAVWSEGAGCAGILVYTDNGLADPWSIAQSIMGYTTELRPLVAVQPAYMHPYWVAKQIATLALTHGRAVDLNILAGGFRNDLHALGDDTAHDDRYARAVEYSTIVRQLVEGRSVTLSGRFYHVEALSLRPLVPEELRPRFLISGSSTAGMEAAAQIGATAVRYPGPPEAEDDVTGLSVPCGIRVGIIAREHSEEAWVEAADRFPHDRSGQIAHAIAMKTSDSQWHRQLSDVSDTGPYWLHPFRNYSTFCPYLVGGYGEVAQALTSYLGSGYRTLILDIPVDADDIGHASKAISMAIERQAAPIGDAA